MPANTEGKQIHHLEADLQAALIWKLAKTIPEYLDDIFSVTGQGDTKNLADPATEISIYVGHARSNSTLKMANPYQENEDLYYDVRLLVQNLAPQTVDPSEITEFTDLAVDRRPLEVLGAVKASVRAFTPFQGIAQNVPFTIVQSSLKAFDANIFHWSVIAKISVQRGPEFDNKYSRFEHLLPSERAKNILPPHWRQNLKIAAGVRRSKIGGIEDDSLSIIDGTIEFSP